MAGPFRVPMHQRGCISKKLFWCSILSGSHQGRASGPTWYKKSDAIPCI